MVKCPHSVVNIGQLLHPRVCLEVCTWVKWVNVQCGRWAEGRVNKNLM